MHAAIYRYRACVFSVLLYGIVSSECCVDIPLRTIYNQLGGNRRNRIASIHSMYRCLFVLRITKQGNRKSAFHQPR